MDCAAVCLHASPAPSHMHPTLRPLRPLAAAPRAAPRAARPAVALRPHAHHRRPRALTLARAGPPARGTSPRPPAGAAVWDAVDVVATLGAVAGALAFVATQEVFRNAGGGGRGGAQLRGDSVALDSPTSPPTQALLLTAPATLPLLALFAARRRQRALLALAATAAADAAAADTDAALEDLRADVAAAARAPAGALRAVDAKLTSLEGAVDKAAGAARAAASAADGVGAKVSRAAAAQLADAMATLRRDVVGVVTSTTSSSTALAPALDARLTAVERALASLSAAQAVAAPSLARAVASSLDAAVGDVVDAVRDEVGAALASVRRESGSPRARASPARGALDTEVVDDDAPLPPNAVLAAATPAGLSPSDREWLEERLRSLAAALDGAAARRDGDAADTLAALTETAGALAARDTTVASLDPDQWGALGRRLSGLEAGLAAVAERPPPDVSPLAADVAALRAAVDALQSRVTSAAADAAAAAAAAAVSTSGGGGDSVAAVAAAVETALAPVATALDALRTRVDAAAAAGDTAADAVALLKRVEAVVGGLAEKEKEDGTPADTLAPTPAAPPLPPSKDAAYTAMQDLLAARNPGVAERVAERNEAAAGAEAAAASPAAPPSVPRPPISAWLADDAPPPEPALDEDDTPSIDDLVARGKAALCDGRALLPRLGAEPAARRALDAAAASFEAAVALDAASVTALGNWGNALAARGALEASVAAAAAADGDTATASSAEAAAEAAWVAAGDRYRRVAELAPSDGRALANWARALAARAGLSRASAAAERLLESAAAKLDAVLASNPRDARAARDAGVVLVRLAAVKPASSAAERDALRDGLAYLADARAMGGAPDDGGEAAAAAEAAAARLAELQRVRR